MAKGRDKGFQFERDIAVKLSLWWTYGKRSDIFWRTGGSGGRARLRSSRGHDTFGSHGDIGLLDPIGAPLLDLLTIELKRGYNRNSVFDLLDRKNDAAEQVWEEWIRKAEETRLQSGSASWAIIARRDHREPIIVFPSKFYSAIDDGDGSHLILWSRKIKIDALPFHSFLHCTTPERIKEMARNH